MVGRESRCSRALKKTSWHVLPNIVVVVVDDDDDDDRDDVSG